MLDIEDFKKKLDKKSRIMGIDPGGKRIGIAISDENKIVATPYTTIIKNNYPDFIKEIKKHIDVSIQEFASTKENVTFKLPKM